MTKERLAQIQRQLEEKQAEAERQKQQIAALAQQQADAQQRIEGLKVAVKVAEQEKSLLQSNLDEAKQQVEAERLERQKVMAQTGQLAEGVGQAGAEVRRDRPGDPFQPADQRQHPVQRFPQQPRVRLVLRLPEGPDRIGQPRAGDQDGAGDGRQGGLRAVARERDAVPGDRTAEEQPVDWERITGEFGRPPVTAPVSEFQFLALDPRLIVIPVDAELAARLGVKVYKTALEPFKFPEAVLVSRGGAGYGEVPFKLDAQTPQYVRMDNRIIKHLIGEFTPTAGDLVFAKTGELIGIMVNSDYCAVIDNFLPAKTIKTGEDTLDQHTGGILAAADARLMSLPSRLQ